MSKKLLRIVLAVLMVFALSANSFAAYFGNAVYREFGFGFFYFLGHSGVVDLITGSNAPLTIVHMTNDGVKNVSLSTFKSGGSPSGYWGEYGVSGTSNATYLKI